MRPCSLLSLVVVLGLAAHASGLFLTAAIGTTTLTAGLLGTTTLVGGLGGLIGLKLVALKAGLIGGYIGSRLGRKYDGGQHYAPQHHYGSSGHSYHRRRRAAQPILPLELDQYFAMVAAADLNGCGLKLVCELEASDPDTLADDQRLILALFRDTLTPPPPERLRYSAKAQYDMAAFLGRSGSSTACQALYQRHCPYTGEELMQALRTVDS